MSSSQLQTNLVNSITTFNLDKTKLQNMFKPDNIKSKDSISILKGTFSGTKGLISKLNTSQTTGINVQNKAETDMRKQYFGTNGFIEPPSSSILDYTLLALDDFTLKILLIAAIFSLVIGISTEGLAEGWYEGTAIFVAVTIIVVITVANDYAQDQQFRKLFKKSDRKVLKTLRGGRLLEIEAEELLVGDIVEIHTGLIFPVDMILISKNDIFKTNEAQITGESKLMKKNTDIDSTGKESPFLISGTMVMDGSGFGVVVCVGINSFLGQMRSTLHTESEPTPLQIKLEDLANTIGLLGSSGALLTFIGCILGMIIVAVKDDLPLLTMETLKQILNYLILAITIIVMAVPEGLPMAVTIALAFSVNKMKQDNNLVRKLEACETMGSATDICSDKTGTLTKNDMTVIDLFVDSMTTNVSQNIPESLTSNPICREMCTDISINSSATPNFQIESKLQTGNRTEMALLFFAHLLGIDYNDQRQPEQVIKVRPFSSERKKMSTLYVDSEDKTWLLMKGAPDIILNNCEFYKEKGGLHRIDDGYKTIVYKRALEVIGRKRARAIGVCKVEIQEEIFLDTFDFEEHEKNMVFLGIFGIMDPIRPDVPEAVLNCHKAGVVVRMVTGDNVMIATAIAKQCHILPKDYRDETDNNTVMDGSNFRQIVGGLKWREDTIKGKTVKVPYVANMNMFEKVAKKLRVLGRSLPEDKLLLVTGLQALGKVVAVTGDGTNDASALKKANVGFGMGKAGTDVCKDASDIILLDDNFSSIVVAIKYGRNVFDAIRKFVQFQLTCNLSAMAIAIISGFIIRESPINSIQMLWLNVIMDSFASLALATEPPVETLLFRSPTKKTEKIVTEFMWKQISINVLLQLVVLFPILFVGDEWLGVPSSIGVGAFWDFENGIHFTFFFNCFVFLQIFNFINARKLERSEINIFDGITDNPIFIIVMFITVLGQVLFVQTIGKPVRCAPLSLKLYMFSAMLGSLSWLFSLLGKVLPLNFIRVPNFLLEKDEIDVDSLAGGIVSLTKKTFKKRTTSKLFHI